MYLCLLSYCQNRKCGNFPFLFCRERFEIVSSPCCTCSTLICSAHSNNQIIGSWRFHLDSKFLRLNSYLPTAPNCHLALLSFFFVWLLTVWRQDVKESGNWLLFDPVLLRRDNKTMLTSLFTFRLNAFRCLSWLWLARVKYLPSKRNKFFVPKSAYKPMHTCNFLRFIYPQLIALLNSNF